MRGAGRAAAARRTLLAAAAAVVLAACAPEPAPIHGLDGDARQGKAVIARVGCGACHTIPGIRGARGVVGPPLDRFAHRTFIAGVAPNEPATLVRFLRDPPAVAPGTAMPPLVGERQARDVAAFLYTLR